MSARFMSDDGQWRVTEKTVNDRKLLKGRVPGLRGRWTYKGEAASMAQLEEILPVPLEMLTEVTP